MDKESQDLAWACLPKEIRNEIRLIFNMPSKYGYSDGVRRMLIYVYGYNLTYNTEPEEMLMVERKDIINRYKAILAQQDPKNFGYSDYLQGQKDLLESLYASKCVPDKEEQQRLCDKCANESYGSCKVNIGCDGALMPTYDRESCDDYKDRESCDDYKEEQPKPKYSIGDKVKVGRDSKYKPNIGTIREIDPTQEGRYLIYFGLTEKDEWFHEDWLEPYTEHTKPTMRFKVGNKVRVIDYDRSMGSLFLIQGKICVISGITSQNMYSLELVDDFDKHIKVNEYDTAEEFLKSIQWDEKFLEPHIESEPKFNKGDRILWLGKERTIKDIIPGNPIMYEFEGCTGLLSEDQIASCNPSKNKR